MSPEQFRKAYERLIQRAEGRLLLGKREEYQGYINEAANAFMVANGFQGIGRHWHNLKKPHPQEQAPDILPNNMPGHLTQLLRYDIVQGSSRKLDADTAQEIAENFYKLFQIGRRASLANGIGNSWNPVSDWTFDRAFVAMDDVHIGAIVFLGED